MVWFGVLGPCIVAVSVWVVALVVSWFCEFVGSGMVLILGVADFLGGFASLHGGGSRFVGVLLRSVLLVVV